MVFTVSSNISILLGDSVVGVRLVNVKTHTHGDGGGDPWTHGRAQDGSGDGNGSSSGDGDEGGERGRKRGR